MHRKRFVFGVAALFLMAGIVTAAEQGRSGAPKAAKPTATAPKMAPSKTMKTGSVAKPAQVAKSPKTAKATTAPKAPSAKTAKVQKPAPTKLATAGKPAPKSAKSEKPTAAKVAKAETKAAKAETAKTAKSTTSTTTATASTAVPTTLTAVQEKLKKNTNLAANLTSRLPAGTDLMTASAGFRNLGQFVAAVNVSNNLGISFTQLKTKMVTGGMSLGQAIQALRPLTASATVEAQRAEYDARGMIAESELQPQPTAPASSPTASKVKAKAKTHTR